MNEPQKNTTPQSKEDRPKSSQYSTFHVDGKLYGIDVMHVQEIVKALPLTVVPLAPEYVRGLINLRGQVATAIGLRELFQLERKSELEPMYVVCKHRDCLVSLLVDSIGDVVEVSSDSYVVTPKTISWSIRKFMGGVYQLTGQLMSVLDTDQIFNVIDGKSIEAKGEAA